MYVVLESDLQDMQTFDKVLKINDQYILALSPLGMRGISNVVLVLFQSDDTDDSQNFPIVGVQNYSTIPPTPPV